MPVKKDVRIPKGEAWKRALILEAVRAAVLEEYEKETCRSEDEALIMAWWKLLNPWASARRASSSACT